MPNGVEAIRDPVSSGFARRSAGVPPATTFGKRVPSRYQSARVPNPESEIDRRVRSVFCSRRQRDIQLAPPKERSADCNAFGFELRRRTL